MSILRLCAWLESTKVAGAIRESTWLFPTIETIHVLCIVIVVGSIAMFDLRLLGLWSRDRSVTDVYDDVMPWTRASFVCAVIAGGLLFSSSATKYYHNIPFRLKMLTLLLAGVNTAYFEFWTRRGIAAWNNAVRTPRAAKLAGGISLVLWILVVAFGRWIGFTKQ
ncbi:MAG TPA: DUF6644 family protein [Candidatus Baltobacteraceae bacterium]|nr:DUF6644 family protein [Candidatus Baltobacteraceae bacterium]